MNEAGSAHQEERLPVSVGVAVVVFGLALNGVWLLGGTWLVGYAALALVR